MRPVEVEVWARRAIETLRDNGPEDSRVEAKEDWPVDPNKAARQIAAHCNAARGDTVLWVLGITKDGLVRPVDHRDTAPWWQQVVAEMDGTSPRLTTVVVPLEDGVVVALAFEPTDAPYVVRNAVHGQPGGGAVALEVPWREGMTTRTARRGELLSVLLPKQSLPQLEVTSSTAQVTKEKDGFSLNLSMTLYATLPMGSTLVFPAYRATCEFEFSDIRLRLDCQPTLAGRKYSRFGGGGLVQTQDTRLHTVHDGDGQLILEGPGFFRLVARTAIEPGARVGPHGDP